MKALIEKKLEGCGKQFTLNKSEVICQAFNPSIHTFRVDFRCPSCKSYLQGIKDSLKDELKSKEKRYMQSFRVKEISELIKLLEGKGI